MKTQILLKWVQIQEFLAIITNATYFDQADKQELIMADPAFNREAVGETTVSFDLYKTLDDALLETWDPKTVFPTKLFPLLAKIQVNRPGITVYRLVKVISA